MPHSQRRVREEILRSLLYYPVFLDPSLEHARLRTSSGSLTFEGSNTHWKYGSALKALWMHLAAPGMSSCLMGVISPGMVRVYHSGRWCCFHGGFHAAHGAYAAVIKWSCAAKTKHAVLRSHTRYACIEMGAGLIWRQLLSNLAPVEEWNQSGLELC